MSSTHHTVGVVAAGTTLVLVAYVVPMLTIARTVADLAATPGQQAWMLSSMSVGLAATLLATGVVGDRIGRRRVLVLGSIAAGLGGVGTGLATSTTGFIAWRVVAGVGGGAVLSCGLAMLAHEFTRPTDRSAATAAWAAGVALGISLGAVAPTVLDPGNGWQRTYVVVGLLTLALVPAAWRWTPESTGSSSGGEPRRLDVGGLVTLSAGLVLLVGAVTEARSGLGPRPIALAIGAIAFLGALVVIEVRSTHPLVDPVLVRNPGFVAATTASLAVGLGIIGMMAFVPFVVVNELGGTLWSATILVLAWSVTSFATSLAVRRTTRTLPGSRPMAGALLAIGASQLLALGLAEDSSPWRLAPALLLAGLATGVLNALLGREAVATVPATRAAMGSGANNTARYLGAACGITLFVVIATRPGPTGVVSPAAGWDTAVVVSAGLSLAGALAVEVASRHAPPAP